MKDRRTKRRDWGLARPRSFVSVEAAKRAVPERAATRSVLRVSPQRGLVMF